MNSHFFGGKEKTNVGFGGIDDPDTAAVAIVPERRALFSLVIL